MAGTLVGNAHPKDSKQVMHPVPDGRLSGTGYLTYWAEPEEPMADALQRVRLSPLRRWQFSLRGLFIFSSSIAVGLSFWKTEQDWFVGALAVSSFWIVVGLAAQMRDIWTGLGTMASWPRMSDGACGSPWHGGLPSVAPSGPVL